MASDMANIYDPSMPRRDYGEGSVYQRASDGRWVGTLESGFTETGARRRTVVTAKTEAAVKRKLRDAKVARDQGKAASSRLTVKGWADQYLEIRVRELRPKAWNAAASPIRRWVIPTIGHKRLDAITPGDIRAVATAQRNAKPKPLKTSTQAATHRALLTMLRRAVLEGHQVPTAALMVKPPAPDKSDREGMTVPEGLACLKVAGDLDHGSRWLVTLLYGLRQGEGLGLTWDSVDFTAGAHGEIRIEWQLQALPYITARDRKSGFRVPDGFEARHLVDSWHLVRPKSKQGVRVAPLLPPVRDALVKWRTIAPANPWGLVWPTTTGRPANTKLDLAEWHGLQNVAEVGHPAGRAYHVHECRNFAATMLLEANVPEHVVTSLLGHSSIVMSRKYLTVRREPLYEALERVGERLQLA